MYMSQSPQTDISSFRSSYSPMSSPVAVEAPYLRLEARREVSSSDLHPCQVQAESGHGRCASSVTRRRGMCALSRLARVYK